MDNKDTKMIFIGASTAGKSSIIHRLKIGSFDEHLQATIGSSFVKLTIKDQNYQIWDTAGQERFNALLPMYFRHARIIMFVFDISSNKSFEHIKTYLSNLQDTENHKLIFVCNKIDLLNENDKDDKLKIVREKISLLKGFLKIHDYVFVSAKTGENFELLIYMLYKYGTEIEKNIIDNVISINMESINITNDENIIIDDSCKC